MSLMRYNYGGISNATQSIDKFIRHMDAKMDEIETALKPLEGEAWNGMEAQEAYLVQKDAWRASGLAIAQSLIGLKTALDNGAQGMRDSDLRAASMFG